MSESQGELELRILLADDSQTDRHRLRTLLEKQFAHAKVHEVDNGDAAVQALETHHFDILLTDQHMGAVPGIAVLQKAKDIRPETLRIMMTADLDLQLLQEALRVGGVQGYLLKAWPAEKFVKELQRLIMARAIL